MEKMFADAACLTDAEFPEDYLITTDLAVAGVAAPIEQSCI